MPNAIQVGEGSFFNVFHEEGTDVVTKVPKVTGVIDRVLIAQECLKKTTVPFIPVYLNLDGTAITQRFIKNLKTPSTAQLKTLYETLILNNIIWIDGTPCNTVLLEGVAHILDVDLLASKEHFFNIDPLGRWLKRLIGVEECNVDIESTMFKLFDVRVKYERP